MLTITEDSYGVLKRLIFFKELIEKLRPKHVLDVGCGTGENLTIPLAEQFPDILFLAIDVDATSIEFAKKTNRLPNLTFDYPKNVEMKGKFDMVIASEVIEHVDEPGEFLLSLRSYLTNQGTMIITVPNGFGPYELVTLFEILLQLSGIKAILRSMKHLLVGKPQSPLIDGSGTLALSPHVNFFSFRELRGMMIQSGLRVVQCRPRTFLCGFGIDNILKRPSWLLWNAKIADSLPYFLSSDWMFVLENADNRDRVPSSYKRGLHAKIRKYLNATRWQPKT